MNEFEFERLMGPVLSRLGHLEADVKALRAETAALRAEVREVLAGAHETAPKGS